MWSSKGWKVRFRLIILHLKRSNNLSHYLQIRYWDATDPSELEALTSDNEGTNFRVPLEMFTFVSTLKFSDGMG